MSPAGLTLRPPRPDEEPALAAWLAALNRPGPQHCLHLAETEAGIRADFARDGIEPGRDFLIAADATGWRGAVGLNRDGDGDCGWLHGPWSLDEADRATRAALIDAVLATPGLAQVRAFCDVRAVPVIADLEAAGFVRHSEVHVMQATRPAAPAQAAVEHGCCIVDDAEDGDAPALAALHHSAFPQAWLAGDSLLAHARAHGRLFVARDAARGVLGSLYLGLDAPLAEADVEFLVVRAGLRGRGIGRALLDAALREAFGPAGAERVNLCVNDANLDALRLYERCGFQRLYTGASLRWLRGADDAAV